MNNIFIIAIVIILILFIYKYQENLTSNYGKTLSDASGKYKLSIDKNGNLVMYDTSINPPKIMEIKSSGNFSGLFSGQLISADKARALVPQNDGNLVLYWTGLKSANPNSDGYVLMWETNSCFKFYLKQNCYLKI